MNPIISKEEQEVIGVSQHVPAVSIIMPFEPKMSVKSEVEYKLKIALAKVEKELLNNYTSHQSVPLIRKLQSLVRNLNYNTHKKTVAIFVSPLVEKVFYLDIPVEEKIVIDESFEIRDLVYSKKQTIQYLILLLSGKSSKMYLGNCSKFALIKSNVPDNINAYKRDLPERVTHFSDTHHQKEIETDQFLHHMDEGLSLVLNAYPLPVFVMGPPKVLGQFKKMTKHEKNIIQYVHGNYEKSTEPEIREIIKPHVADWNKVRQQNLLQQIDQAMSEKKLAYGINEVWTESCHKNGRLLIVEKDFIHPAHQGIHADIIRNEDLSLHEHFYIKDAVDDVMEKILESGGDIEFVDNNFLQSYGRIALIKYH
ncbi:MAG: hypothetical protein JST75_21880 [Bacteroidetes bacterium]|nr:hypothetical protein [Bacteroidota bacterium]